MKRFTILSLFIIVATFTSCEKDNNIFSSEEDAHILREISGENITRYKYNADKIESIFTTNEYIFSHNYNYSTGDYGSVRAVFSYDGHDRIRKVVITPTDYNYGDVKEERHYEYYGNVINVQIEEEVEGNTYERSINYYVNSTESYLEKIEIEDNNKISTLEFTWENGNIVTAYNKFPIHYAFDNKKNPYHKIFSKNCIFAFNLIDHIEMCSKNNLISPFNDYKYDEEDYPTQRKRVLDGDEYIENYVYN